MNGLVCVHARRASTGVRRAAAKGLLGGLLLLAMAAGARAQQPLSPAETELRGETIFQQSGVTGMVLVVVRNREVLFKSYGETFPGSGVKPDANSLVRLCSISKIFAGELLTELANEGTVKLDDPLQKYAPVKKIVPTGPGGTPITLEELATHTAGLPREVSSYPRNTPHFTFPDAAFRWNWLPKQKLKVRPGTAAVYSNIGFDLLGDALADATHKSYARLLSERIIQPLGLRDTTFFPNPMQCARLLRGAADEGACTPTEQSGASGGVYSTPTDMARVLEFLLHSPGSPAQAGPAASVYLKPADLKSVQGLNHAGDPTGIGLGWVQVGDPAGPSAVLGKTGGGAGFETYIALSPARQTGIFLAVTDGKGHPQGNFFEEGNNLLAALANVPPIPQKVRLVRVARRKPAAHRRSKTPLVAAAPSSAHRRSTTARAAAAPSPAHRRHRRG